MAQNLTGENAAPLNTLDKEEMFDLGCAANLNYTREQFEKDWADFVALKKQKQLN